MAEQSKKFGLAESLGFGDKKTTIKLADPF